MTAHLSAWACLRDVNYFFLYKSALVSLSRTVGTGAQESALSLVEACHAIQH